jgi:glutathione peroxidase-family protein
MKITEITYSEGKTIQEASYEPRSFHFSAKAEVSGDNIQDAYDILKSQVKTAIEREILSWRNPQKFARERAKELEKELPF